jgi:hypothetical protein
MPRALLTLLLLLAAGSPARAQEGARAEGNRLREALAAAGVRPELAGTTRLQVRLGELVVGSLVLETQVVAREDGEQVYRVSDRLLLDLPGQGTAHMTLAADLRADLSLVEARLETEEPRGVGQTAQETVTLFRRDDRWVRRVESRAGGAPTETTLVADLPPDALPLTPPLGAGERLARLVPPTLGLRLSVRALDLETGQGATWRCSVEEALELAGSDGSARPGLLLVREEGAAGLESWREREGGAPWRVTLGRLVAARKELAAVDPDPPGPARAVLRLLRATAARDREAMRALVDLDALLRAAGDPQDAGVRGRFAEALLDRLADPEWLAGTGLPLAAEGARARDLEVSLEPGSPARARVSPVGQAGLAFRLEEGPDGWKIVDLPR